jgi:hypothetical protein
LIGAPSNLASRGLLQQDQLSRSYIGIASSHIAMSSGSIIYISISSVTAKTRIRYLLQGGNGTISNAAATPQMSL